MKNLLLCISLIIAVQTLYGQSCLDILNNAKSSFQIGELRLAMQQLQDAETCDSKNELERERQDLQIKIFDAVEQAKIKAEESDSLTKVTLLELKEKNKEVELKNEMIANAEREKAHMSKVSEFQEQINRAQLLISAREYKAAFQILKKSIEKIQIYGSSEMNSIESQINSELQKCDSLIFVQKKFDKLMREGDSLSLLGICCKTLAYGKYKEALRLDFNNEFAQAGLYKVNISVESKLLSNRYDQGVENPVWISAELSLIEGDKQLAFKKLKDLERSYYSFYPHGTGNDILKNEIEEIGVRSRQYEIKAHFDYFIKIMDKAIWGEQNYTDKFSGGNAVGYGLTLSRKQKIIKTEIEFSFIQQKSVWGNFENKDWLYENTTEDLERVYSGYNLFIVSTNPKIQLIKNFYSHKKPMSIDIGFGFGMFIMMTNSGDSLSLISLDETANGSDNSLLWNLSAEAKFRLSKKAPFFLLVAAKFSSPIKPLSYEVSNFSNTPPFDFDNQEVKYFIRNFSNRIGLFYAF